MSNCIANTTLKQCCRQEKCVHPSGPLLDRSDFYKNKATRDGYTAECKECIKARQHERYATYSDKIKARVRDYRLANPDKVKANKKKWQTANRDKIRLRQQQQYKAHAEEIKNRAKQWRIANRSKKQEANRRWAKQNPDKIKASNSKWQRNHRDIANANTLRRRARKKELPCTFTNNDWTRAMKYWNDCCAVCGRSGSNQLTIAADHWIPVKPNYVLDTANPGTVPGNILPLCHGPGGCNNSKGAKHPAMWLRRRVGEEAAKRILDQIETYFASLVKDNDAD